MKIKFFNWVIAAIFGFISVTAVADSFNGIAAVVNDSVITQQDLDSQLAMILKRLQSQQAQLPSEQVLKQQVLQQMIDRELQLQQAKQLKLQVTPDQIDQAIIKIAQQNNITVAQLYQSSLQDGYTKESFQDEVSKEILMQMVQDREVASRISISQQEVDDYLHILASSHKQLAEYHLGDILIALPDSPSPSQVEQAKAKAEKVIVELKQGADFNKLAMAVSSGEDALKGGDLGWRKLAELPTPFVPYAKQMQVNQVVGPIRTPNGFHVIKLFEVRESGLEGSMAQQRSQVEQMIFERQFNQALLNWIAQLRAQAYIKIY